MSFNILNGGQGSNRNDEWLDPILEENADIIVINEAAYWEHTYLDHYVNKINEYHWPEEENYTGYVTTTGGSPAIAFLSRFPFLECEALLLGTDNRVFGHARFNINNESVDIFGVHLKSGNTLYDRNARKSQILALIDVINGLSPNAIVFVMGDFNCYSPVDVADPTIQPNWNYSETWTEEQSGTFPIETMLNNGFIDTFRVSHPSKPGWTCHDTHPEANYTAFGRIDYQFVSANKKDDINSTDRIYDPIRSPTWSDHVPLVGSYWFGERPTSTTTSHFNSTTSLSSSSQVTTTSSSTGGESVFVILGAIIVFYLVRKKDRSLE